MDINDLVDVAHAYAGLGWAVQEQLAALLDEGADASVNVNAAYLIREWATLAKSRGVDADELYALANERVEGVYTA